jgi:hypothetical protein
LKCPLSISFSLTIEECDNVIMREDYRLVDEHVKAAGLRVVCWHGYGRRLVEASKAVVVAR